MSATTDWITPDWPAPATVRALSTSRSGGLSTGVFASLNLGAHVGDDPELVAQNRQLLQQHASLPATPAWLNQVHGTQVLDLAKWQGELVSADASVSQQSDQVCLVMTADCLPVLFCDRQGRQVAAAHAGWRGLCVACWSKLWQLLLNQPMSWPGSGQLSGQLHLKWGRKSGRLF